MVFAQSTYVVLLIVIALVFLSSIIIIYHYREKEDKMRITTCRMLLFFSCLLACFTTTALVLLIFGTISIYPCAIYMLLRCFNMSFSAFCSFRYMHVQRCSQHFITRSYPEMCLMLGSLDAFFVLVSCMLLLPIFLLQESRYKREQVNAQY
jgi:hypothetical protein